MANMFMKIPLSDIFVNTGLGLRRGRTAWTKNRKREREKKLYWNRSTKRLCEMAVKRSEEEAEGIRTKKDKERKKIHQDQQRPS